MWREPSQSAEQGEGRHDVEGEDARALRLPVSIRHLAGKIGAERQADHGRAEDIGRAGGGAHARQHQVLQRRHGGADPGRAEHWANGLTQ